MASLANVDGGAPVDATTQRFSVRKHLRRAYGVTGLVWFCFFVMIALWSVATPHWASPDEPSHAFRAYGVAHGQIYVTPTAAVNGTGGFIEVPRGLVNNSAAVACFIFRSDVTADCARVSTVGSSDVKVASGTARYNPFYYFLVGLPSLVFDNAHLLTLMRLVSAALSAWMLAWTLTSAAALPRARIAVGVVLFAITPMTLFIAGTVNPNGLEITAAASLWVNGLLLCSTDDARLRRLTLRRTAVSAAVLVAERSLSPVWLLVIAALVFLGARSGALRRLWQRDTLPWAGFVVAVSLASVAWVFASKSLQVSQLPSPLHLGFGQRYHDAFLGQDDFWKGEIGVFGWLDTRLGASAYDIWAYVGLTGAGIALVLLRWRERIAFVLAAAVTVFLPPLFEAFAWNQSGPVWQPRYSLPLSIGVPLIAAVGLGRARRLPGVFEVVVGTALAVTSATIGSVSFILALHRYVDGAARAVTLDGPWQPPLGAHTLAALQIGASTLVVVLALVLGKRLQAVPSTAPESLDDPIAVPS